MYRWVDGLDRGERGGLNEVLWAMGGWVGGEIWMSLGGWVGLPRSGRVGARWSRVLLR